jgi:PAS domain S-box-containing protein
LRGSGTARNTCAIAADAAERRGGMTAAAPCRMNGREDDVKRIAGRSVMIAGLIAVPALAVATVLALGLAPSTHVLLLSAILLSAGVGWSRGAATTWTREAQFRELAESIHEVLWMCDLEYSEMFYVSPAYSDVFGLPRAALYADARNWMQVLHPDDRARIEALMASPARAPRSTQYRIVRPDGAVRSLKIEVFPVRDATGAVTRVAGRAEDITERVALEEQVRQTQKLESLGLLAGGVAHDFNNILAVIGASSGMLHELCPGSEAGELIGEVTKAVRRGAELTRPLLAFSRKQATEHVVLDPNSVISDTRKMLRRMLGEDIELTTSLDPGASRVRIDAGQLVQVLMNLAVNARDAMARGGTLTITTRNVAAPAGPTVRIAVADTGCGMTGEVRRRAFEPLFTTKGVTSGTGLGLSVVHGIVESAGGSFAVTSELGHGTTFEISLPALEAPAEPIAVIEATSARGVETILFVDDDPYVRASASRALRSRGYVVVEAGDGHAALRALRDELTGVDLLVTDVVMPGMDGRQLADAACSEQPALRVLYTSGYADEMIAQRGIRQGQVELLEKPYDVHRLAGKVREVLDVVRASPARRRRASRVSSRP